MRHQVILLSLVLCSLTASVKAQNAEDAPPAFDVTEWEDISRSAACAPMSAPNANAVCADDLFGGCVPDECRKAINTLYDGAPTKNRFRKAEETCLAQEDPCRAGLESLNRLIDHRRTKLATLSCQTVDDLSEAFRWSPLFANPDCRGKAERGLAQLASQRCQVERKREECDNPMPDPVLRCALKGAEIETLRARKRELCAYTLPRRDGVALARLASCETDEAGESEAQCLAPDLIEDRLGKGCRELATVKLPDILLEDRSPSQSAIDLTVAFPSQADANDACFFGLGLNTSDCTVAPDVLRVSGRTLYERGASEEPSAVTAYFGLGEAAQNQMLRVRFTPGDKLGETDLIAGEALFPLSANQCSLDIDPRATGHAYALRRSLVGHIPKAVFDAPPHTNGPLFRDCARLPERGTLCWSQSLWQHSPPHFVEQGPYRKSGPHERLWTWRPDAAGKGPALTREELAQAQKIAGASPFYRLSKSGGRMALWVPQSGSQGFHVLSSSGAEREVTAADAAWLDQWLLSPPESAVAQFDWWLARWPLRAAFPPTGMDPEPWICWAQGQLGAETLYCGRYGLSSNPISPLAPGVEEVGTLTAAIGHPDARAFFAKLAELAEHSSLRPVTWFSKESVFDDRALLTQAQISAVGVWHDTRGRSVEVRFRGRPATALAKLAPEAQRWVFGAGAESMSILPGTSRAFATTSDEAGLPLIVARLGECTLAHQSAADLDNTTGWIDLARMLADGTEAEQWFASTAADSAEKRLEAALACLADEDVGLIECGTKNLRALLGEAASKAETIDTETQCGG